MARIVVTGWRSDGLSWSGWASHARSELRRRLRKSLNCSLATLRAIERRIKDRVVLTLDDVDERHVEELRHILEAVGAEVIVDRV